MHLKLYAKMLKNTNSFSWNLLACNVLRQVMSWPSLTEKAFAYNLSETPSIHRISNVLAQAYVSERHMKLSLKCCVCHVLDQCILTWLTSTIVQFEHNSYVKQIYASVNIPSIAHFMHKVLYDNWMADQAHDTSLNFSSSLQTQIRLVSHVAQQRVFSKYWKSLHSQLPK